jgi:hypothetical protein
MINLEDDHYAPMQLECKNLQFQYPGTSIDVFKALSFELPGPGFHALFGPVKLPQAG